MTSTVEAGATLGDKASVWSCKKETARALDRLLGQVSWALGAGMEQVRTTGGHRMTMIQAYWIMVCTAISEAYKSAVSTAGPGASEDAIWGIFAEFAEGSAHLQEMLRLCDLGGGLRAQKPAEAFTRDKQAKREARLAMQVFGQRPEGLRPCDTLSGLREEMKQARKAKRPQAAKPVEAPVPPVASVAAFEPGRSSVLAHPEAPATSGTVTVGVSGPALVAESRSHGQRREVLIGLSDRPSVDRVVGPAIPASPYDPSQSGGPQQRGPPVPAGGSPPEA